MRRLVAVVVLVVLALAGTAIFASASQLVVRPASITSMVAAVSGPLPVSLALTNGGATAGLAENGDRMTITFPRALDASTLCPSSPASPTGVQTISSNNAVVVTVNDGGAAADTLTVSTPGACGGTFNLGTVELGSTGFTSGGALTFGGNGTGGRSTISYDPATFQVVVVLGTRGGPGTAGTVGSVTAVYTPSAALKYLDGTFVSPATGSTTGVAL